MQIYCKNIRDKLNARLLEHHTNEAALERERKSLHQAMSSRDVSQQANHILQAVFARIQENVHKTISDIVTRCLQAVFGEYAYTFRTSFPQKRNKTEAELEFVRNGLSVDPLTQSGGGVLDVASFGLRLAAILLSQVGKKRHILILDEPFKFVSENYRPKIRDLIEQLASELGMQVIMVTHMSELEIGDVVRIGE